MNKYAISFDLVTSENENRQEDYDNAEKYLQSLGYYYCKPLHNVYLIATNKFSNTEIRDYLKSIFRKEDNILVVDLNGAWASYNSQKNLDDIRGVLSK